MKSTAWVLFVVAITLAAGAAGAEEGTPSTEAAKSGGYYFGLAGTIGEGMYFTKGNVYRSPVSLEMVPSFGWSWFKFDLGLSTTVETIQIADTNLGAWNFTFRPGGRLPPPFSPLYLRAAVPLRFRVNNFDWGLMLGVGADIPVLGALGIVIEADTTLNNQLNWGADGIPLEFRAGLSFHL